MEGREGMNSGVTVIGAEAPSAYHVAPRAENPNKQATTGSGGVTVSVSVNDLAQTSEKKKRGRPRKYGPDGAVTMALSPFSILSASGGDISSGKRGKGRSAGSEYKQHKKIGMENLGDEWNSCPVGINFMPHIITVNAGEDVTMKVISFSQQGPRAICILSANGIISNVTLRQPDSSGGTLTYEGRFEILSLSGSFMPTETEGTRSRSGGMSVSLASPDGRVVGGSVAGLLIAASPVQVVVGSFIPSNPNESKVKKHKADLSQASNTGKQDGMIGQHGYQNSSAPRSNNIGSSSPFQRENWMTMHPVQESTNTATDINISLPGG